jgi:hypothetical protein
MGLWGRCGDLDAIKKGVSLNAARVEMAQFYDVVIHWRDRTTSRGRGIGNNAAWQCKCGEVLLFFLARTKGFTRFLRALVASTFRIVRRSKPGFVERVIER